MQRPCGKDYSDITTDSGEVSKFCVIEFEILMLFIYKIYWVDQIVVDPNTTQYNK